MSTNRFRQLPSVHQVLQAAPLRVLAASQPPELLRAAVRRELAELRQQLRQGPLAAEQLAAEAIAARVAAALQQELRPRLCPVLNATGILLHTNLGRAPLAEEAARAAYEAGRNYLNLELDLASGRRSSRQLAVRDWLCRLTGAESALVVNNNAAATILALRAVAAGKEVLLSRGQLIEIGGSFRLPEIMAVSGALLREVGTTNITRLSDYERALSPQTGALLHVHTSNYRLHGHVHSVPLSELVALGRRHGVPVLDDIGSGALVDFGRFGLTGEPVAAASIAAGADLVLFSGDKLLGGPQAGVLVGRKELIQKIEKDPFLRAVRPDKMTLAALEATLRLYLQGDKGQARLPLLQLLQTPLSELQQRAERLVADLHELPGLEVGACPDHTYVGGGSLPDLKLPTWVVTLRPVQESDAALARRLRLGQPPVLGRLHAGHLLLDLRSIFPEQDALLAAAVRSAWQAGRAGAAPSPAEVAAPAASAMEEHTNQTANTESLPPRP
jgi:L-seryl-tRNA(Ser) seleniumtransferase